MPRNTRKLSNSKVYHIILRGIDRQDIFLENQDYCKFLKELSDLKEKYQYEVYAYCLMTNHIHLVIFDRMDNLSKILQSISISYVSYFNKKYDRVGHLFQNRFSSKNVETREYLMEVCRYIHRNPVKAGISTIDGYQWSSYQEYIKNPKIISTGQLMKLFGNKKNFIDFNNMPTEQNDASDLLEYEIRKKLTDEEAQKYITQIANLKITEIKKLEIEQRNELILKLKTIKGTSKAQMARVTGINRKIIERTMKMSN